MSSNRNANRKPKSSRARNRRLARKQANNLNFETLEARHLLASLTVSNATDLTNADTSSIAALVANDGGDGISLREAVIASNNTTGEDTISFDASVFTGGANSLIRLTQGELSIQEAVTIDGSDGTEIVITGDADANDALVAGTFLTDVGASLEADEDSLDDNSRVIYFASPSGTLSLSDITVTGGRTRLDPDGDPFFEGGGISSPSGSVSLTNSSVSGNSSTGVGSLGGGIFAGEGSVTLLNSSVTGNETGGVAGDGIEYIGYGGGIFSGSGTVSLTNSTVSENGGTGIASGDTVSLTNSTVSENEGAGILTTDGTVTLTDSTVSGNGDGGISTRSGSVSLINSDVIGNEAIFEGGGIYTENGSVTLLDSNVSGNSSRGSGGGIYTNEGSVSLTNSTVSDNITTGSYAYVGDATGDAPTRGGSGGGVYTRSGSVNLINSTVSGNHTNGNGASGGGVSTLAGSVQLIDSTVSGNSTTGFGSVGGGIFNAYRTLSLINSTVSGNSTSGDSSNGGGISTVFGTVSVTNSTISGNSTTGDNSSGGGIDAGGYLTLTNATVTGNSASGRGGGLYWSFDPFGPTIVNSIIAGNTDSGFGADISVPDGFDNSLLLEHSLIGDTTGLGITATTGTGNILNQPASLGPLADNGGVTLTHALLFDSPAINAGSNALAVDDAGSPLSTDQRSGGFDRVQFRSVDIGAFESNFDSLLPPVVVSTTVNEGGVLARPDLLNTLTIVFDRDVTLNAASLSLLNDSPRGTEVDLTGVGFSYDASTSTATWDFSVLDPQEPGFYTFRLDPNSIASDGATLDGNGDGIRGDAFEDQHYVAIPGDANLDGTVDLLGDGFPLVTNLGTTSGATWADGDFNADGRVDVLGDAFILIANLNRSVELVSEVVVSNTSDLLNGNTRSLFDLIANDGGDGISLREAIVASNNTAGDNTITFDESIFTGGTESLIRLTQGELEIRDTLTIDASNATDVTITGDANGDDITIPGTQLTDVAASFGETVGDAEDLLDDNSRVINFLSTTGTLTLSNTTVTGGRTTADNDGGGGIYATGIGLSLFNSTVSGNSTSGFRAEGGGIYVDNGNLSLTNSIVSSNRTFGSYSDGGGIAHRGGIYGSGFELALTNSTVSENSTFGLRASGGGISLRDSGLSLIESTVSGNTTSGAGAEGGGIFNFSGDSSLSNSTVGGNSTSGEGSRGGGVFTNRGELSFNNSTVSGNRTSGDRSRGGGVYTGSGDLSFYNSTVSGNSTSGDRSDGGGVHIRLGALSLTNSTVTENSASESGGGIATGISTLMISNSIVASNSDSGVASDIFIPANLDSNLLLEHSLIGDTTGSGITATTGTGNILNQTAQLAQLADNGGPTLTHALLPGSPGIDNGNNTLAVGADGNPLTTDQRGDGFDRIQLGTVDIGAFESNFDSLAAATSQSAQLTLAGDHDLRDDVFGSDF